MAEFGAELLLGSNGNEDALRGDQGVGRMPKVSGNLGDVMCDMPRIGPIHVEKAADTRGKVGRDLSTEDAYKVARDVGLNLLGSARSILGSLDRVKRVVKVLGMVNAVESFGEQPKVINGFSDLMVEVFGDNGRHARSAVGMGSLPRNISVEIEAIFEIAENHQ